MFLCRILGFSPLLHDLTFTQWVLLFATQSVQKITKFADLSIKTDAINGVSSLLAIGNSVFSYNVLGRLTFNAERYLLLNKVVRPQFSGEYCYPSSCTKMIMTGISTLVRSYPEEEFVIGMFVDLPKPTAVLKTKLYSGLKNKKLASAGYYWPWAGTRRWTGYFSRGSYFSS